MNKAKLNSIERIKQSASIIEQQAQKELVRLSQARRKTIVSAYETLTTHCYKLNVALPKLGTWYKPQEYLDHARIASEQVAQIEAQEKSA